MTTATATPTPFAPTPAFDEPARPSMWRRLLRDRAAMVGLAILVVMTAVAVLAPWIAPFDPTAADFGNTLAGPSAEHWLGTDNLGRDILSRLIAGARVSMRASAQTVALALVFAVPLGLLAGYVAGWADTLIMRATDALMSFPALILALTVAGLLGPSLNNVTIALAVTYSPTFVRLVRAQTHAVRRETFIDASRVAGSRDRAILARRILPNVASPIIVQASLMLGGALLAEAALSFLGLGVQPPQASWGGMLRRAYDHIFAHPMQLVYPGVAIAVTVLGFNLLGDGLRDALGATRGGDRGERSGRGQRRGLTLVADPGTVDVEHVRDGTLLEVDDLAVEFDLHGRSFRAVDGVGLTVCPGEVVGLVGESGSGKSVTSLAIMRLVPSPPGRIVSGQVRFQGRDLLALDFDEMRRIRGREISMVFQDPMSNLDPVYTVGSQIVEAIRLHEDVGRRAAWRRTEELLHLVGIPVPAARARQYPHEFSGGMRQRAMIAMALACSPKLLIADEPTTALDVTIQAQILDLLRRLRDELGLGVLFVTHDLGVVADVCDRVTVMYAGRIVEQGPVDDVFARPSHPYTEGLLAAMPSTSAPRGQLPSIPGVVPPPHAIPEGCRFEPRCPYATDACRQPPVPLVRHAPGRRVRCVRHDDLELQGVRAGGAS